MGDRGCHFSGVVGFSRRALHQYGDGAAARTRLRLGPRDALARTLGQPALVRTVRSVRGRVDGPLRHPTGHAVRVVHARGCGKPELLYDPILAVDRAVGCTCWSWLGRNGARTR